MHQDTDKHILSHFASQDIPDMLIRSGREAGEPFYAPSYSRYIDGCRHAEKVTSIRAWR